MTFYKWSQAAATNASIDSTINWAEGQSPSSVNDSARAMMAAAAKYRDDISGKTASAGGTTAYTFTSSQGLTTLTDGYKIAFTCNATNTGACTLNVDGLGAAPLQKVKGTDLAAGELVAGCVYTVAYDSASTATWVIHGGRNQAFESPSPLVPVGSVFSYGGASAPAGFLLCYGQAISRTNYAALFTVLGSTFGAGDGSTTFNLPDLRGRVIAGQDDMGGTSANRLTGTSGSLNGDTLGASGGAETHTITAAQSAVLTYTSTVTDTGHVHPMKTRGDYDTAGASQETAVNGATGSPLRDTDSATTGITVATTANAGGQAHNNVQPTFILNYIIKT